MGHVTAHPALLAKFAAYWERLAADPSVRALAAANTALCPVPSLADTSSTVLFSPQDGDTALGFYAELIRRAEQATRCDIPPCTSCALLAARTRPTRTRSHTHS